MESKPPGEYVSPVPSYAHSSHDGLENEYEDFYIDAYFGSDGSDHGHYRYDNWADPELVQHNHSQLNPYAKEHAYQPDAGAYWVPIVVESPAQAYVEPEHPHDAEAYSDDLTDLQITPLDLDYWLNRP